MAVMLQGRRLGTALQAIAAIVRLIIVSSHERPVLDIKGSLSLVAPKVVKSCYISDKVLEYSQNPPLSRCVLQGNPSCAWGWRGIVSQKARKLTGATGPFASLGLGLNATAKYSLQ